MLSPCRSGAGERRHHCSTWHADLVTSFRAAQAEQNERAEAATGGYDTELAAYFGDDGAGDAVERRLTFKDWLCWTAGANTEHDPHPYDELADVA